MVSIFPSGQLFTEKVGNRILGWLVTKWLKYALSNRNYRQRSKSYNPVWYLIHLVFVMSKANIEDIGLIVAMGPACGCVVVAAMSYTFLNWIL
jgi:hypothetical protein